MGSEMCIRDSFIHYPMTDDRHGIVHVVGPEQGITLPGLTLVCGDSHTSTHGALGCISFGIGSTEVQHVMATQTLWQRKPNMMRINLTGEFGFGVSGKDIVLAIIAEIGAAGGTGYAIEFAGNAIDELSMEGRMTLCNMSIEAGARSGIVAPDDKTIEYCAGRPYAPRERTGTSPSTTGEHCVLTTTLNTTRRLPLTVTILRRW